jgi:hypothetical protein
MSIAEIGGLMRLFLIGVFDNMKVRLTVTIE